MKYENPNPAAFFLGDHDAFLNLEEVVCALWDDDDDEEPVLRVFLRGASVDALEWSGKEYKKDYKRLLDALRIYHSKA